MTRRAVALLALCAVASSPARAQEVRAGITPDTGTVGSVMRAMVQVSLPAGYSAAIPDSLPISGELENLPGRYVDVDTLPAGGRRITIAYPFAAWRPGEVNLPALPIHITGGGTQRTIDAVIPPTTIRSVLPADTTGVQPKPAKDVLGPSWMLWPFILLGVLLLLLAALAYWWWRRRRKALPAPVVRVTPPREEALRELDRIRALGLLEAGEVKSFYILMSDALRRFLDAVNPRWGTDLTSSELLDIVAIVSPDVDVAELRRILLGADLVKFARRRPSQLEAEAEWRAARDWITRFPWAAPAPAGGPGEGPDGEPAQPVAEVA